MILFTGTILSFFSVPLSQIYQGLLSVFYNLGDGDFNLTMPSYRLDNGEWHDIHLDRHDNELTLRLDGGGGRREVTGSPGRSREIVIDPAVVMLGNSLPSGHNKSFQGKVQVLLKLNSPMTDTWFKSLEIVFPIHDVLYTANQKRNSKSFFICFLQNNTTTDAQLPPDMS